MKARSYRWLWLVVPVLLGLWLFWPRPQRAPAPFLAPAARPSTAQKTAATFTLHSSPSNLRLTSAAPTNDAPARPATNRYAARLTNTRKSLAELEHDPRAILLANAFIDTRDPLNLNIPKKLQAQGDPGAYVVQAKGETGPGFRAMLTAAGAQIVSYIPNNAYLVQASSAQTAAISADALTAAVLPYEPYYKVAGSLLTSATPGAPGAPVLNLGLFPNADAAVIAQLHDLGVPIVTEDRSPFGTILRVVAPPDWMALAQLPGVHVLEPASRRTLANDLSRVALGVSADTVTNETWLGLSGSNVVVEVNDSGIEATHPDFTLGGSAEGGLGSGTGTRVYGDSPGSITDTNGHGTHVGGSIAGNGAASYTLTNTPSGSVTNADFRGKAPLATLYSVAFAGGFSIGPVGFNNDWQGASDPAYSAALGNPPSDFADVSDYYLQSAAVALTNALISNNSWTYGGDNAYDLAASSYDAAVRDALPYLPGSQPVLFVFAAGNAGYGNDDGTGGDPDSIESPGTAKNVITVGALQQDRNITNIVTVTDQYGNSNSAAVWQPGTSSSDLVAYYSSRGNVGIDLEGQYGRFKPDVMAPGTFVISTASSQWNQQAYYDPTNDSTTIYQDQIVNTNGLAYYFVSVPNNTVGVNIQVENDPPLSPVPFPPNMPVYVELLNPPAPPTYDFVSSNNVVNIPPDLALLPVLENGGFWFAVGNPTNFPVFYNVAVTVITTNDDGNFFQVFSNLNVTLGPYYRYETGTSMSAASVSGVLALMEDFFTNTLHQTPSPALLKAMLINGAQTTAGNQLTVTNPPNFQGWGLVNLPSSLPAGLTNLVNNPTNTPMFFLDQSPTNALATGDSQTFTLSVSPQAQASGMRLTLVWTDPPGDPSAAIKLVNNLDLIVTNLDETNVYYGNNFAGAGTPSYSLPTSTNAPPVIDMVNNVRNIFLPPPVGTNFTVTVLGRSVNVNAVTAQTNNVVQDFALVISAGDGTAGSGVSVAAAPVLTNPTGAQTVTYVTTTNAPLLNQIAGENSPLLGTNTAAIGSTNSPLSTNAVVTLGQTNQWHFYVVTNTLGWTNAAFITFNPFELAVSRMGTLADSAADAVRPEADIDLYVSSEPGLTNLDPVVISNCLNGVQVSGAGFNDAAAVGPGGTEFVAYTNSLYGQVYYLGIKSEDHLGAEYGLLPVFSQNPFSTMNADGSESVNGLTLPVNIPPGSPAHPSTVYIFALALYPLTVDEVIVTNGFFVQNFGGIYGQLQHNDTYDILNNHDAYGSVNTNFIYYDAPANPISTPIGYVTVPPSQPSDGPGSLINYRGQTATGPWILTEADNVPYLTGSNTAFGLRLYPHTPPQKGFSVWINGQSAYYDYIDVPAGVTNLILSVTNETVPVTEPPLEVYLRFNADPSPEPFPTVYDEMGVCTNGTPPGCSLTVGPSSIPPLQPGRYYYEVYNPSTSTATNVYILATLQYAAVSGGATFASATVPATVPNDAVATNTISITNTETIFSAAVGVVVNSPRVSDLTLTLVSPLGQRYVLFENRGGNTATNLGHLDITTNFFGSTSSGGFATSTNVIGPVPTQGVLLINYDMYTIPDQLSVYYDGVLLVSNPPVSFTGQYVIPYGPGISTNITIVMNQYQPPNPVGSDLWTYTPAVVDENYIYLTFTDDTNLAPVPIKFALPPFDLTDLGTNYTLSSFEAAAAGDYLAPTNVYDPRGGWNLSTNQFGLFGTATNTFLVTNNQVSVVTDPATAYAGSNFLALAGGTISRLIPTTPNREYTVSYAYRGPGLAAWWRGEGNALDSASPETNGNNGRLIGRFTFPAGEVGQAFALADQGQPYEFAGTNNYVQVPQSSSLDVGPGSGMTVEGWINPTNLATQQPLVEWLAHLPPGTNTADTNLVLQAGPFLNRATGHYYYLLGPTNWTTSERWATNLGGHLVTLNDADEQNWVYDTFADYAGTNRNLWLGLNDEATAGVFVWTSGETTPYANWLTGQPGPCNGDFFTAMLGATNGEPGLWTLADNNGDFCGVTASPGACGVVELDAIPTNGVQLWVSVTNSPATGDGILSSNGCLYANLVDITNGFHEIWSAPGLLQSNVYQHVALTYDTNSGVARLYYNGTNVCSTNLGVFTPLTTGDVLLGKDMNLEADNFYSGEMDEMSVYGRCLSDSEILAIYQISALSTNGAATNGVVFRTAGKFDPAFNPALGLA